MSKDVVFVGSYGSGISTFHRDGHRLTLAHEFDAPDPTFLVANVRAGRLYACHEYQASVGAYQIDDAGVLTHLNTQPTSGDDPCYVLLHPAGYLITANYGGGSVAVHPIQPDGTLGEATDLRQHTGSGPDPDRQAGPHAHQVVLASGAVVAVDLGADRLFSYRLNPNTGRLEPTGEPFARANPGAGPRHTVAHPSGHWYVTNELDGTVSRYAADFALGGLKLIDSVSTTRTEPSQSSDPGGRNYPSGLVLSADGSHLYVASRGPDTLSTFRIGEQGGLTLLDEVPCDGCWPRDFSLVDDLILVANQRSGSITGFRIDDYLPRPLGVLAEVPGASCALPVRLP